MGNEKIMQLSLGALATNCYIIPGEVGSAVVVDPASSGEVMAILDSNEMTLGGIVLTHGHYDHFAGAASLKKQTGAAVYAPDLDSEMFQSAEKSWAWFMGGIPFEPVIPDHVFADGSEFSVSGVSFRVMAAPGHTAGSCLLFCERFNVILAGDVLFQNGVGRTDGFSGSAQQQRDSLRKIKQISGNYEILCGHGETSYLEIEKKYNPYLR